MIQSFLNKAAAQPRAVFLMDGLGAALTAFLSGVVLVRFEELFGMPQRVLLALTAIACGFAVYSFTCAALNITRWQPFMRLIALLNTLFCCLTAALVVYYFQQLTALGVAYFVQEWLVVGAVVWVELATVSQSEKHQNMMKSTKI
jgi:hypothetical protein